MGDYQAAGEITQYTRNTREGGGGQNNIPIINVNDQGRSVGFKQYSEALSIQDQTIISGMTYTTKVGLQLPSSQTNLDQFTSNNNIISDLSKNQTPLIINEEDSKQNDKFLVSLKPSPTKQPTIEVNPLKNRKPPPGITGYSPTLRVGTANPLTQFTKFNDNQRPNSSQIQNLLPNQNILNNKNSNKQTDS